MFGETIHKFGNAIAMMKPSKSAYLGLMCCLVSSSTAVAQTTNTNSVVPRFTGSFTTQGAGYEEPYFSIEGFIPFQATLDEGLNDSLTFLEGRMLWSTDSTMGGNLLLGHRFVDSSGKAIWGGYVAYDVRDTGNKVFNQIGVGLERLGKNWDVRVNGYLPIGTSKQEVAESLSNWQFEKNNLLLDIQRRSQVALAGFDLEVGGKLIGLGKGDLRGYGGLYYYSGEGVDGALGIKGRLEAYPTENFRLGLMVQHDPIFDTRVVLNASVDLGGNSRQVGKEDIKTQITQTVQRIPTIAIASQTENIQEVAINPKTGKPWQFRHVNNGSTGNGTIENPAGSIQTALNIAQPEDIVYVEFSPNINNQGFNVPDHVAVFSTAPIQTIDIREFGKVQLPGSGNGNSPVVNGTVTMGNNTTLSGFALVNVTGNAIQASDVSNVTIRDNQITNSTGQGISLSGVGGENIIANNLIQDTGSQGIFLQAFGDNQQLFNLEQNNIINNQSQGIFAQASGNSQQQIILKDNLVNNNSGSGIFLQANNNSQQEVNLSGGEVRGTKKDTIGDGGQGIFIAANDGGRQNIKLENIQSSQNESQGLFLSANSGGQQIFSLDNSIVSSNGGQGVFIQTNGNSQQEFTINQVTINNTRKDSNGDGGQGLFIAANSGAKQQFNLDNLNITDNLSQGLFIAANGASQQQFIASKINSDRNSGQGIFIQANGNSNQDFEINQTMISATTKDSNGDGGQGLFIAANGGSQQTFKLNNLTTNNNAAQGIFVAANGDITNSSNQTRQNFTISNPILDNNIGQSIFVQANDNVKQEFTIINGKVSNTKLDNNNNGGQGIFIQANGIAQQNSNINQTSITNSANQGIFVQTNGNTNSKLNLNNSTISNSGSNDIFLQNNGGSRMSAVVELNNLENQLIDSLSAANNSNELMCLKPRDNKTKTGFSLQRNNGNFQVVNRDNLVTNINFQPNKDSFTNVADCP
jgi:trimeric autotransporter adhesin